MNAFCDRCRAWRPAVLVAGLAVVGAPLCLAQEGGPLATQVVPLVDRAAKFLASSQAADGSFTAEAGPGVSALVAAGLLAHDRSPDDPVVAKALAYVQEFVQPDGGIYPAGSRHQNYETCIAMVAFKHANRDGRYDKMLAAAEAYVKKSQWDEDEGMSPDKEAYGGAGYGSHSRPDLSNTTFLIDALQTLGREPNDPAIQRALVFVSRCQNLEGEQNQTKFPALNPDGGFFYTIAAGGESEAGELPNGGLRSYGSMSYAGLKSMIYAGVDKNDPRVQAVLGWIRRNYTLEENPGIGTAGTFYYYHMFAKALAALELDQLVDQSGDAHDWRQELVQQLAQRQRPDGSWTNENPRWLEGDANLVTGYALLSLAYCR